MPDSSRRLWRLGEGYDGCAPGGRGFGCLLVSYRALANYERRKVPSVISNSRRNRLPATVLSPSTVRDHATTRPAL